MKRLLIVPALLVAICVLVLAVIGGHTTLGAVTSAEVPQDVFGDKECRRVNTPVTPTPDALSHARTVQRFVEALKHPMRADPETGINCTQARNVLMYLNEMAYATPDQCLGGRAKVGLTCMYSMDGEELCRMRGWHKVWYETGRVLLPETLDRCGGIYLQVRTGTTTRKKRYTAELLHDFERDFGPRAAFSSLR